jgi:transposase
MTTRVNLVLINICKESSKKYAIITPTTRMAFIKRVLSKQATIKEAAQEFGIKFSTSKAILQTFRREGRVGKKRFRSRKLKELS